VARFLLICLGGAIGTGCRFLLSTWVAGAFGADFPRGTVLITFTGSFFIAVVLELSAITGAISLDIRLFLTTGLMGGYTTYSSFDYETLRLVESGAMGPAGMNLAMTVVGWLAAGFAGVLSARDLVRLGAVLAG
jgi:fluoride exporter